MFLTAAVVATLHALACDVRKRFIKGGIEIEGRSIELENTITPQRINPFRSYFQVTKYTRVLGSAAIRVKTTCAIKSYDHFADVRLNTLILRVKYASEPLFSSKS